MQKYCEKVYKYGRSLNLIGVLTIPNNTNDHLNKPAIIVLNSGLIHRIGPNRMSVEITRRLAEEGFLSIRSDLYGIGDSLVYNDNTSFRKRAVNDIAITMDFLDNKSGNKKYILIGLCAGADNAHNIAIKDKRIVGVVFIDAYGFRTKKYLIYRFLKKILCFKKWKKFINRILSRAIKKIKKQKYHYEERYEKYIDKNTLKIWKAVKTLEDYKRVEGRVWPSKEDITKHLMQLIKRNVKMLFIYSGGVEFYYTYKKQFYDIFPGKLIRKNIDVKYFKNADHTFTQGDQKDMLIETICKWIKRKYSYNLQ